jgi:hypothetical protein
MRARERATAMHFESGPAVRRMPVWTTFKA